MNPTHPVETTAPPAVAETITPQPGALTGLSLAMLLSSLGTSSANVALPSLAVAFAAPLREVQGVVLAYLLTVTALIVGVGRLGDLVGTRRLLIAGLVVFTTSSALCGVAPTLGLLVAARAGQGVGAAAMMALTVGLVGQVVAPGKAGRAMGLLGTMSALGTALGPSVGGLLIVAAGWQAIFLVNLPLGLVALWLVLEFVPADRPSKAAHRAPFDFAGMLLLAAALVAYVLAMLPPRGGQPSSFNLGWLGAAAGILVVFGWVESRIGAPLVSWGLVRHRERRAGLVGSGVVAVVVMTTLIVGPFYLSRAQGLNPGAVGLVLSVGPALAALAGMPAGRLVDRLGAPRVTRIGLVGVTSGALLLALTPAHFGVVGYLGPVVCLTMSYAVFQTANNTAVLRSAGAHQRGVMSGLLSLSRNLGLITGASLMGTLFAWASGTADLVVASAAAVERGMRVTFGVAAALAATSLLVSVSHARAARRTPPIP